VDGYRCVNMDVIDKTNRMHRNYRERTGPLWSASIIGSILDRIESGISLLIASFNSTGSQSRDGVSKRIDPYTTTRKREISRDNDFLLASSLSASSPYNTLPIQRPNAHSAYAIITLDIVVGLVMERGAWARQWKTS